MSRPEYAAYAFRYSNPVSEQGCSAGLSQGVTEGRFVIDEHRDTAERLAVVCAHLEEIREDLRRGHSGGEDLVDEVLVTARAGGDITDRLAVLHAVLQAGGDAHGLDGYGDSGPGTRGLRPVGISDRPGEQLYLCPGSRCARYWWPQPATDVPHCAVSGTALRRERL